MHIAWLRNDLRLQDNPALLHACAQGNCVALYIKEPNNTKTEARDWWLHNSLEKLEVQLESHNIPLIYKTGNAEQVLQDVLNTGDIQGVYWNRRYDPQGIKTDTDVKTQLKEQGIKCESFAGNLLKEPWEVKNKAGGTFRVFTPMCKTLKSMDIETPIAFTPPAQKKVTTQTLKSQTLKSLELINTHKDWHQQLHPYWNIGEEAAYQKLIKFLEDKVEKYRQRRDFMAKEATSQLSPHMHFGEISAKQIWQTILAFEQANDIIENEDIECFKNEVIWREFAHQQLYTYKEIDTQPINEKFNNFPWGEDKEYLKAWHKGQTGIPIVDAGMRELWHTGYMHNRVRMIVASFLTKNLLIPWQEGAKWFMDTLVDADEASNSASWQWVAGCGLDAAPYFRIFNPVTQGGKFDKEGEYVKRWVPELQNLDNKYIHKPWEAGDFDLRLAGITLGSDYPKPIVNLKTSRERALAAYQHIK